MTPDDFITRMTVLYGPPDTIDNEMFLDEYRAVLKGNEGRILKRAGDIIRDTQVRRFWPTPAEVKEAIRKSAFHFSSYVPPEHQKFEPAPKIEASPEKIAVWEAEMEAEKKRVDALAKAFISAMRGPPKAHKDVELPWMGKDEFKERMETIPDRVDLTKRITGERD
jgi:hypothetical protein